MSVPVPSIGQILGHYRIVEQIGAGGMGVVYRAHDEQLDRDVALKMLPAGTLADEAARTRFRKEALALAKLDHPNVATIHEFGSQNGVDFLVAAYVPGITLDTKISSGPLPESEVISLGIQLAAGLAAAHEQRVIHCDLKPGNLRLTPDGRLKILDFGLARLIEPVGDDTLTATLTKSQGVTGTLPYMAPEQLRGQKADFRTDIWAAGAVLYEMATGERPFKEQTGPSLAADIIHKAPPAPRSLKADISPGLEAIIRRCLEKEPEKRYQSADQLAIDLRGPQTSGAVVSSGATPKFPRRWRRGLVAAGSAVLFMLALLFTLNVGWRERLLRGIAHGPIESLAVLPLQNLSRDPEQEYFADGMTEELTTELAQIGGLRVISRTSTMRYKGTQKALTDIAKELGVDAVIEGSVDRSGDQVRISAQLINARTDSHLWARSYQRNLRDILAMQSEVARAIAGEIRVQLTPQEQARLGRPRAVNPAAYEAYLQGRYHWNFHTSDHLQKAIAEYQRAIQLDPSYALAYVGLSEAYHLLPVNADAASQEVLPKAKDAALKALELDPQLSDGHADLAFTLATYDWDWAGAEREYKRAIELSPNNSIARAYYSRMLTVLGRHSEAIAEAERARELDPMSTLASFLLGMAYSYARQYDRAARELTQCLEMNPKFWPAHFFLGQVYEQQGRYADALAELSKAEGPTLEATSQIGHVYGISGNRAKAEQVLKDLTTRSKEKYVSPVYFARVYLGLGQKDQALEWLERGYAVRDSRVELIAVEPTYDSLHSDSRFMDLLRRLNLSQ
jgi:serine/threonine protein kinase/cytochrome c-type biogenesis protein CcmH/NrfG